jgi:glycogen(starch) synthase
VRILHLSWEYPPLVYGGLGRHVHSLAEEQAAQGHEVVVITQTEGKSGVVKVNGVTIIREPRDLPTLPLDNEHLLAWVAGLEHSMTRSVTRLAADWTPDVIHAHDWMVAHVAATAGELMNRPLVATFHATEAGRHQGWLPAGLPQAVHQVEWWLAALATRVITCSAHMKWETNQLFDIDPLKTDVVPNGIELGQWRADPAAATRSRSLYAGKGPLIVFTGRLEWEKGVHVLLDAMNLLRKQHPHARLVIAGKGGKSAELAKQARRLRLGKKATFVGWLPEVDLHALVAAADVAVIPSLYEPFGLVALEAAALETALVVSDTGGLSEIADNDQVALTFMRGDAESLATTLDTLLVDEAMTQKRVAAAMQALQDRYTWDRVVAGTTKSYQHAIDSWETDGAPVIPQRPPTPPNTNLLTVPEIPASQS